MRIFSVKGSHPTPTLQVNFEKNTQHYLRTVIPRWRLKWSLLSEQHLLLLFVHLKLCYFLHNPKANHRLLVASSTVVNVFEKVQYVVKICWKQPRVAMKICKDCGDARKQSDVMFVFVQRGSRFSPLYNVICTVNFPSRQRCCIAMIVSCRASQQML